MRAIGLGMALALLAGCAPGDVQLSQKDLVARSRGVWVSETRSYKIGYHEAEYYSMDCLSGTRMTRPSARVTNVGGSWNRRGDYRVETGTSRTGTQVVARVTHTGARHYDDAPYVTVEMRALCTGPVPAPG